MPVCVCACMLVSLEYTLVLNDADVRFLLGHYQPIWDKLHIILLRKVLSLFSFSVTFCATHESSQQFLPVSVERSISQ